MDLHLHFLPFNSHSSLHQYYSSLRLQSSLYRPLPHNLSYISHLHPHISMVLISPVSSQTHLPHKSKPHNLLTLIFSIWYCFFYFLSQLFTTLILSSNLRQTLNFSLPTHQLRYWRVPLNENIWSMVLRHSLDEVFHLKREGRC